MRHDIQEFWLEHGIDKEFGGFHGVGWRCGGVEAIGVWGGGVQRGVGPIAEGAQVRGGRGPRRSGNALVAADTPTQRLPITRKDRVGPIARRHLTNHSMPRPNPHLRINHSASPHSNTNKR
jgi:hypothetical protein